jgi:alanyl aminopeptidase
MASALERKAMKRFALLVGCALLLSCKHSEPAATPSPAAQTPPPKPDAQTVWKSVIEAPDRSEKDRALDPGRRPAEMLEFLDVKPGMKVADLGAGGGYTTELLARAVGPSGAVYMQNDPSWLPFLKESIDERLTHPAMKGVQRADAPFSDPLPAEKNLDEVVMNVIYHDIANIPAVDRVRMNREIFNALQPGGAYVVIDSSAQDGSGLRNTSSLHRIDEQVVKDEVQKAGFKLVAEGNFLRNPQDARDWNSSPGAATKAGKRGQSDRFALKFVRPEGSAQQLVPPALRLPAGARPTRVAAELTIDPTQPTFEGKESIELSLDAATPLLWLNADQLEIIDTVPASKTVDGGRSFVGLQFAQPLPMGSSRLSIHWRGKLSAIDSEGAFRQQENGEWYAMTSDEPVGARRIMPSFDEPSFKIPWKFSLRVRKGDAAYFNTPVESTEESGEYKVVHFVETLPLPSYLLAFAIGQYQRADAGKTPSGKPIGVVVTRGKLSWAKYAQQASPRLMALLEEYFGIPYHYPKLDSFEVPLGGGAMENPGLISFNQRILLARPGTQTPQFEIRCASVAAHEFAHLWFGDMVTTAWWDDLWLNEAFATWGESKIIQRFQPSWGELASRTQDTERAMRSDSLVTARRIRQPIEEEGDMKTAFDNITYQKGAAVIGMFEQYVGAEQFRKGVHRFLKEHADGNATAKEFLAAISAEAGKDVAPSFSTFLDQPGVPVVTSKLVCEGNKGHLELSQARYLPLGAQARGESLWQIPFCARTPRATTCTLLTEKTATLDLGACPDWALPNAAAAGYYRVALDADALAKLNKNVGKLSTSERMRLFYDANAQAHAGTMEDAHVFELMTSLSGDKDRHVVEALTPAIAEARNSGMITTELTAKFGAWVRAHFGARAHSLGFYERKHEPMDARILRPQVLRLIGDEGGDLAVRNEAQQISIKWFGDHSVTSPDLASTMLILSALDGDAILYDRYVAVARSETDRNDRIRVLNALGHFRNPELVSRGFQIFLGKDFDAREAIALVDGPAEWPGTRDMTLAFVEKNYDAIVQRMPRDFAGALPRMFARYCDEEHAKELREFFGPRVRSVPGGERRLAQTTEEVRQCAAFREKAAPSMASYFAK